LWGSGTGVLKANQDTLAFLVFGFLSLRLIHTVESAEKDTAYRNETKAKAVGFQLPRCLTNHCFSSVGRGEALGEIGCVVVLALCGLRPDCVETGKKKAFGVCLPRKARQVMGATCCRYMERKEAKTKKNIDKGGGIKG